MHGSFIVIVVVVTISGHAMHVVFQIYSSLFSKKIENVVIVPVFRSQFVNVNNNYERTFATVNHNFAFFRC